MHHTYKLHCMCIKNSEKGLNYIWQNWVMRPYSWCFTGKMPSPFVAPYTSTKFALNGFFGSLQHELAMKKSNVSISICTLGLIDTDSAMEKVRLVKYSVSISIKPKCKVSRIQQTDQCHVAQCTLIHLYWLTDILCHYWFSADFLRCAIHSS